jgi:hypothetical protein
MGGNYFHYTLVSVVHVMSMFAHTHNLLLNCEILQFIFIFPPSVMKTHFYFYFLSRLFIWRDRRDENDYLFSFLFPTSNSLHICIFTSSHAWWIISLSSQKKYLFSFNFVSLLAIFLFFYFITNFFFILFR